MNRNSYLKKTGIQEIWDKSYQRPPGQERNFHIDRKAFLHADDPAPGRS